MNVFRSKVALSLLLMLLAMGMGITPSYADSPVDQSLPPGAQDIQQGMKKIIDHLDSPGYSKAVSWEDHIVLVYQLAQNRLPTPTEFFILNGLRKDVQMKRSDMLLVVLQGKAPSLSWEECHTFLDQISVTDFKVDSTVQEASLRLATVPRSQIVKMLDQARAMVEPDMTHTTNPPPALPDSVPNVQYQTYFGYLHAHSNLSDGQGTPLEAYSYARDQAGLDFFGLTDHGELLYAWPWQTGNEWAQLISAAQATYQPGSFATLWGFEWSNPVYGHINVLNTSDFTNALFTFDIRTMYNWISSRSSAFGTFNHPGDFDFAGVEFLYLQDRYPAVEQQMVGIELWNGSGIETFNDYYYNGGWYDNYSYWDEGNRHGWYLGALGGQDNHSRNWGTGNTFRTAVLAQSLTREQIIEAYRQRRFYTTEDVDLKLDVRVQGFPMGSRLTGVPRQVDVTACDGSGDTFQQVRLYRNGDLLQTSAVSGNCIQVSFTDPLSTGADYYYVIVRQNDDGDGNGYYDEAMSSPIWVTD